MKRSQAERRSTTTFRVHRPSREERTSEANRAQHPVAFLPVVVTGTSRSVAPSVDDTPWPARPAFEIVLASRRRVLVPADFDPAALACLLQVLEGLPSC